MWTHTRTIIYYACHCHSHHSGVVTSRDVNKLLVWMSSLQPQNEYRVFLSTTIAARTQLVLPDPAASVRMVTYIFLGLGRDTTLNSKKEFPQYENRCENKNQTSLCCVSVNSASKNSMNPSTTCKSLGHNLAGCQTKRGTGCEFKSTTANGLTPASIYLT